MTYERRRASSRLGPAMVIAALAAATLWSACSSDDGADGSGGSAAAGTGTAGSGATGTGSGAADTGGAEPALPGWPLALPQPEFGVDEEAPPPPDPWTEPIAGRYWVDNSHPDATDDGNEYGTPQLPRATLPSALTAGAVVYVAGGPYDGDVSIDAAGTAAEPIFVTAPDADSPPIVSGRVDLGGSYLIVEHLDLDGPSSGASVRTPSDHIAVRHTEIHGGEGGPSSGLYTGRWNPEDDPAMAEHIVFWDNLVHDNGDWQATFDEDYHGLAIGHHAAYVWVVGNVMFHNSGDGLQVNAKKASLMDTLHHVFVGRNLAYENKQTGLWTKQATDVVFSQNEIHGHRPSDSSSGAGIGFQYGPERVWILFNEIYDCEVGITSSTYEGDVDGVPGTGQDIYLVGNVIHGIHKEDGSGPSTDPWQGGAGIRFTDQEATKHVHHNTVYDADVAVTYARGTGPLDLVNNVMASIAGTHVRIETAEAAGPSTMTHSLFDAPALIRWGDGDTHDVAGFQAAFSGQCAGCLEGEPAFVDAPGGDFRLTAGSPAVDSGGTSDLAALYESLYGEPLDVDADGTARPQGSASDMGAYELH